MNPTQEKELTKLVADWLQNQKIVVSGRQQVTIKVEITDIPAVVVDVYADGNPIKWALFLKTLQVTFECGHTRRSTQLLVKRYGWNNFIDTSLTDIEKLGYIAEYRLKNLSSVFRNMSISAPWMVELLKK